MPGGRHRSPRPGARSRLNAIIALSASIVLSGCIHIADQQSARLLAEGETEYTGTYSSVSGYEAGDSEHLADYFGIRIGHGYSDRLELRGAYERIRTDGSDDDLNVLAAGPKFSLVEDASAVYVPIGVAFGDGVESADTWTIAPTVLGIWRHGQNFELLPSAKLILPFTAGGLEPLLGFNLGAAISTDVDRWALRPEIGTTINPGESGVVWGLSLGLSIRPAF